jgi:peptidoglycan/xylan/chitin deacetylase (PgdA/CDA1 family)
MRFGGLPGLLVLALLTLPAPPATPAGTTTSPPVHYQDQIAVLTYHDVSPTVPRGTDTVSPEEFAAEMTFLLSEGFHFVSVPELEAFVSGGAAVPPNAVCVVFDNGYAGIYKYALPVLEQHHIPAAVFLIVANVGRISHDFTWDQIQTMAQTGLVRFYTETYDLHRGIAIGGGATTAATVGVAVLPDGSRETNAAYRARVSSDLVKARTIVEREAGTLVDAMVYPYGQYTPELIEIANAAGYHYLFTTIGWTVGRHADPNRLPRLDIGVWNQTPSGAAGAALGVAARADQRTFTLPASYVHIWK